MNIDYVAGVFLREKHKEADVENVSNIAISA